MKRRGVPGLGDSFSLSAMASHTKGVTLKERSRTTFFVLGLCFLILSFGIGFSNFSHFFCLVAIIGSGGLFAADYWEWDWP